MPTSPIKSSRTLLRPSAHIPWSIDVVSAVPKRLVEALPRAVAAASCPGWACLTLGDGLVHVWQTASNASAPLEAPRSLKISLPDLIQSNDNDPYANPTIISLALVPSNTTNVHLFAVHQDWLLLRKLTPQEFHRPRTGISLAPVCKTRLELQHDEQVAHLVTTTTTTTQILLSTTHGRLFHVTHTAVPVALQVSLIIPPQGWMSRLWYGKNVITTTTKEAPLLLPKGNDEFWALAKTSGQLTHWKVHEGPTFEPILQIPLPVQQVIDACTGLHSIHVLWRGDGLCGAGSNRKYLCSTGTLGHGTGR